MGLKTFNLNIQDSLRLTSTNGDLFKWSTVVDGKQVFIKASTYKGIANKWSYDSYSELIVCRLLSELGHDNIVMYYPCKIVLNNGIETFGCYSYSFLKENETYVSIAHLNKVGKIENYVFNGYDGYMQCIKDMSRILKIDTDTYRNSLDRILEIDYIVLNSDRHLGNFGLVFNSNTGKFSIAPIFDNGNSLFSLADISEFDYTHDLDMYIKSKPFVFIPGQQIQLVKDRKYRNKDISNTLDYIDGLSAFGLDRHRINFIKHMLEYRIHL